MCRYQPSQADLVVLEAVGDVKLDAEAMPHLERWHRHISSFDAAKRAALPGDKKSLTEYGIVVGHVTEAKDANEDDDDIDLFGSDDDEEDDAAAKLREQRLAEYAAKKAKKPGPIAKSSITFDVKPWDDETDLAEMERNVRSIEMDGLVWGASKLVPVGYGIKKLRIICVVEDDKVSTDALEERIKEFEDFVQSVDIEAFAKI